MEERRIGTVVHYFGRLNVVAVRLAEDGLRVGDRIHIKGHTTDLQQSVESLQIENQVVAQAGPMATVGLKVVGHCRTHDTVYKVLDSA